MKDFAILVYEVRKYIFMYSPDFEIITKNDSAKFNNPNDHFLKEFLKLQKNITCL